jgi:hypothetical protein
LKPCAGSIRTGAVMSTPGIGPATVGAVGVELFEVWQPPSTSNDRAQTSEKECDLMGKPSNNPE